MKKYLKITVLTLLMVVAVSASGLLGSPVANAGTFTRNTIFSGTGRDSYKHNSRYSECLIADGIDISYYQSTKSDWVMAKKSGVDFAIIRVSYSGYGNFSDGLHYKNKDSNFKLNFANTKAAGMMTGAYVFSQAKTAAEAKKEANYAIDLIESYGLTAASFELPIYMDYEYSGGKSGRLYGLSDSAATTTAVAFCDAVRARGYKPGIYANTTFFKKIDASKLASDVDLWCAQYYSMCESDKNYSKWQYSSSAKINYIYNSDASALSNVDVNYWYLNKSPSSTNTKDLASCTAYGSVNYNLTGNAIKPKFELVNANGKTLTEGKDYVVGYINNIRKGNLQAYAYITGVNNASNNGYTGFTMVPFTIGSDFQENIGLSKCKLNSGGYIFGEGAASLQSADLAEASGEDEDAALADENAAELSSAQLASSGYVISDYNIRGIEKGTTVSGLIGQLAFDSSVQGKGYSLAVLNVSGTKQSNSTALATGMLLAVYKNSQLVGTANITVDGKYPNNTSGNDIERNLMQMKLSTTSYYYNGSTRTPIPTVTWGDTTILKGRNSSNSDVKLSYASGRRLPGTYTVSAEGITYPGSASAEFTISVKPTSISSITAGTKKFTVKATKQGSSYVTGYYVRYSKYSSMVNATSKCIGTKYTSTGTTVTGLKAKTSYYVQVRSYKKIGDKKYYSKWSESKKITTK